MTRTLLALVLALVLVPSTARAFDPTIGLSLIAVQLALDGGKNATTKGEELDKAAKSCSSSSCGGSGSGSGSNSKSNALAQMAMMQAMQAQQAAAAAAANAKRDSQSKQEDKPATPPPPPPPAPAPPQTVQAPSDVNALGGLAAIGRSSSAPLASPAGLEAEVLNLSKLAVPNVIKAPTSGTGTAVTSDPAPPHPGPATLAASRRTLPTISEGAAPPAPGSPELAVMTPSAFPRTVGATSVSGSPSIASTGGVTGGSDSVPAGLPTGSNPSMKSASAGAGEGGGGGGGSSGGGSSTAALMAALMGPPPAMTMDAGGEVLDLNWNAKKPHARRSGSGPKNLFEYASLRYRRIVGLGKAKKLAVTHP